MTQAEIEYKDFETFFPNMPEAAEAQLKIANIHYQEMEKPDRDYTHAMRAEEEYRQLILQYPDNKKVVEEGKKRLMEVQEVIAEREYRVGRFYFLRQSYPAAIARLRSLMDKYPLYSKADEALFLLGQAYESEVAIVRSRPGRETDKARMIQEFTKNATEAYSRILTRYPLMDRTRRCQGAAGSFAPADPQPTKAALAQNKAEEESRREASTVCQIDGELPKAARRRPGRESRRAYTGGSGSGQRHVGGAGSNPSHDGHRGAGGQGSVAIETLGTASPAPDQPAPRSDAPAPETAATPADNPAAPAADPTN